MEPGAKPLVGLEAPFANLHSFAHRWCHELCFMQMIRSRPKIIISEETEKLLNIGMQDGQEEIRFAYNLLIIQFLELFFFFAIQGFRISSNANHCLAESNSCEHLLFAISFNC